MTLFPTEDFEQAFRTFRYSVFRLETLQVYRGSGEDEAIAAFERGDPAPPFDPLQDEWEDLLRAHRRASRLMQRVHVVVEPLSDYLQFELTWMYGPNVAVGGERIGIINATRTWPLDIPRQDFTLFDSSALFLPRYTADGDWLGVEYLHDPVQVVAACRARDAALHHAQSWEIFVKDRPNLAARLPRVAA